MSNIFIYLMFKVSRKNNLSLRIRIKCNDEFLDLNLSNFLQFLYKNKSELGESEFDYLSTMGKFIKRIEIGSSEPTYGLSNDIEMGFFLEKDI